MELYFLGTGAGIPSLQRNVSSLAIRFMQRGSKQWLFDCGEATQHQILQTPISLSKIDKIFISHLHGDHIFGLPGIIGSRSFQGAESKLTIYGPKGLQSFVETALKTSSTYLKYPIEFVEVTQSGPLFNEKGITVEVLELEHVMPCYAYKVVEDDKPGELLVEKLKALNIAPGPSYQKIKRGESITLDDGRIINGQDFVGMPQKGRSLVIAGDTKPVDNMVEFSKGVDLLVHEATFLQDKSKHAKSYGHSTALEAAHLAAQASVKMLILTHISSRYVGVDDKIIKETHSAFENTIVAHDLMHYIV
ncbi:ribonuclease Z [Alkalihalobacillus trypoxylicola]|uniref:Ribonuclease Z n=1 Tax=Alkalihalobacillus trypoxylicola TaxID=519424 RepID=A0A161PVF4_9BACI|nr:ribonuclease Z [Alkalihalobacillus trypoxylicola]KYG25517.1 ribonuclease Z [Alkalihalobacillus trypoxylicola]